MKKVNIRDTMDPYLIEVDNTTDKNKNVVLFGWNKHWHKANLGSDEGVNISCPFEKSAGVTYQSILASSITRNFNIGVIRVSTPDNVNYGGFNVVLTHIYTSPTGSVQIKPYNLHIDPNQFQSSILDTNTDISVEINAETEIAFSLKPKQKLLFYLFPLNPISFSNEVTDHLDDASLEDNRVNDGYFPNYEIHNPSIFWSENLFSRCWNYIKYWIIEKLGSISYVKFEDDDQWIEEDEPVAKETENKTNTETKEHGK